MHKLLSADSARALPYIGRAHVSPNAWWVHTRAALQISAEVAQRSAGLRYNLHLSVDAGTWMACAPAAEARGECMRIVHGGANKTVLQHVVDIADRVQIMDYDTTAPKVLGRAAPFLDYADATNKTGAITCDCLSLQWRTIHHVSQQTRGLMLVATF